MIITTFLIYGKDAVGKSSQLKSICETTEDAIVISLELKNRKLYGLDQTGKIAADDISFEVVEPLVLEKPPSFKIVPVETYHAMGKIIERILNGQDATGKKKQYKTVVIDGISDIARWSEQVVIGEMQKRWDQSTDSKKGLRPQRIGKDNKAAWAVRNNLAALPLERLAAWAEINNANVFFTTLMTPEYVNDMKSGYKIDIQDRIRDKVCEVRVCLSRDGRGYTAKFEKVPSWSEKQKSDEVAISDGGLFVELAKRGLL